MLEVLERAGLALEVAAAAENLLEETGAVAHVLGAAVEEVKEAVVFGD
jgi:hypothetical protein